MTGDLPARDSELLDDLVDSFLEGLRRGEAPTVEAYAAAHPRLAGQIRELFPALETLERCADGATSDAEPSFPGLEVLDAGDPGVGGMGKVYKARELSLDRVVAVKVTRAHLDTPAGRAFFEGEARAAARLDHPHIVKVFSFQPDHVPPYYVMQYVEGRPLEHACRGRGGRDWQLIARLLEKVARAIHYAHDSGIVHRDIKPANILVDYENEPHVTDFGLAKSIDGLLEKPTGEIEVSSLRGTPHYIAPDLYDGGAANAGTDIYALGITMYVVLTGRPPFSGQTFEELRDAVREADPPVPKDIDPEIPEPLQRICLKAMEPRPDDRYASAQTMAADLQRFAEGREVFARPTRYLRERRGRLQNHLTDIHLLRRQNLIDTREMDRLMRPYHGMLEADSAWDELSRRFPWETALLRLGGWLAVVSGVLWLPWYWDDLVRWQRIAALALPCFLVNLVGWLYLRRGSRLNGTVFLSTGSLLLPLLIGVVLAEYRAVRWPLPESWEVFGADALRPGLGQFVLTNVQINVAVGAFFGYALALLAIIRAKVFGIWAGVGTYIAFSALLLLVGLVHWLDHDQVATALSCYTPVCLLFIPMAGLLRSRAGPGWAAIFYSFFPIPLWLVMTMLARYGGEEWLGAAPEWDAEPVQLWLMANGLLYLAIGLGHARARTGVARFWGEFFMLLVPVSLLVPTNVLFEKAPYLGHAGPHPISLYEWAAFGISVTLVVLGTVLRRGALVAPGLAGFALAILRTTDRHFQDQLAWPLALAGLAGLAMALGAAAAFVRNRRKPGASA